MKFRYFPFVILLLVASCKPSVKPVKPEASYDPPKTEFDRELSYINIPMEIALSDIQKQINAYVKGVLYEDNSFTDNDNDGLKCKVKKYSDIIVEGLSNKVRLTVPLDIAGSYKALGVSTDFKGVLKATYVTQITLKDNWKLETITKSAGHEWIKSPAIDLYLFELPVTSIADAALEGQQEYIEKEIDKAIREYVDLKEYLKDVVRGLYEPMLLSETYKTWFCLEPKEIYTSQINTQKGIMHISLGMKTYTETHIGPKPPLGDTTFFPAMKVMKKMPDDFNVGLVTLVKYPNAAALLKEQYVDNPYTYTEGKRSVTLTHIDLWGQDNRMVIECGLKGSVNGMVYLLGTPGYDSLSRNIILKNVDFHVDTKNKLLKTANWLLHGKFAKIMEKNMYFEMGKQLDASKKDAQMYLTNYKVSKGIRLNGKLTDLRTKKVYLTPDAIVAVVTASGKLSVKVEGME